MTIQRPLQFLIPAFITVAAVAAVILAGPVKLSAQAAGCTSFLDCFAKADSTEMRKERIKYYTKALEKWSRPLGYSSKAAAYNNRGGAYRELKQYDKALADYNKAIELDPNSSAAHSNRAGVYSYLGQYDKAISGYSKAIQLDPRDGDYYSYRADTYFRLNKCEKARTDLDKAIGLDSLNPVSCLNMAEYWWICRHDKRAALNTFEKSFKLGFNYWDELYMDISEENFPAGLSDDPEFITLVGKYRKELPHTDLPPIKTLPAMQLEIRKSD